MENLSKTQIVRALWIFTLSVVVILGFALQPTQLVAGMAPTGSNTSQYQPTVAYSPGTDGTVIITSTRTYTLGSTAIKTSTFTWTPNPPSTGTNSVPSTSTNTVPNTSTNTVPNTSTNTVPKTNTVTK